ncbi:conserved Plasmodium protein, unknown function [Plasmodium berghei]|uniref:YrhK domain-containing protein n=2 Tax=Plasmodium berghei TaxID=5821 RepID=A0A509AF31_PLABA|nr:conserved Plasmodium protein, unknown function [Plasmodium berghei ANKA]CXI17881.1 conserved Plasmodium protein, unknown function [Plasmodium berghei]SCM19732.1 conserved Plasmodium protein, unknown function [Plasmodium berghei]SCN23466.1 conserved Plasmodium protein, unknown function [Plasmodium berghei]SCO59100.1 conserved Plasmodium protein, unknown function [Plasmodium berghei]SCO59774.1 conserved Plasmodium protein, unknown function [Plasmodium berghei]|eukprot:XP_034420613.1 conserved Plasmodium protein, unknown function [Plasmodium berghei ANKA]
MKTENDNLNVSREICLMDFINCPLCYHTNFISMVLFIIGSTFFIFNLLYISGCIIFAIASSMCLYSNIIGAYTIGANNKKEFYGYINYTLGCLIFAIGSIYCCFKDDSLSVKLFIFGSSSFLIGALCFIYGIDYRQIKSIDWKVLFVYIVNLLGSVLFTIASFLFFYPQFYNYACYLYIEGSILFTLGTWFDYIIYINSNVILPN